MTSKLAQWANAVKERDGWKCKRCPSTEDLHAHHMKPKSTHPELALDVDNGETLCYRCHKAEHEKNRPVRIRSNKPQRRVLEKRIAELEGQLAAEKERSERYRMELYKHLNKGPTIALPVVDMPQKEKRPRSVFDPIGVLEPKVDPNLLQRLEELHSVKN